MAFLDEARSSDGRRTTGAGSWACARMAPGRELPRSPTLQRQRKPITLIIAGVVVVLLIVAVADALRSGGADTRPPPAEASATATEATETAADPSDTDGGWDDDAT